MADDNRVILDYDEIAELDDAKLEAAKKKFQEIAYPLVRDVTPVVGEAQSYKYAMQDAQTLAKAARSEPGYDDMTPVEALGYVGLTALGVAGMTPLIGPAFKSAAKGIRALMPNRGTRQSVEQTLPGVQTTQFDNLNVPDTPMNDALRASIQNDPRFNIFVDGLPDYRRTPESLEANMNEYRNIYRNDPTRMAQLNESYSLRNNKKNLTEEAAQADINQGNFDAKVLGNSSKALTIPKEPLTFGKGLRANKDDTVRSYLGSSAWDEVNKSGNAMGTPQEWLGFLKGLRQKGIKAEELSDSGLLIFGKGGEPVGGDIFNLAKDNAKLKISKSEILAALESNPTFRMKTKDYKYPINTDEVLNVYPNFAKLSREVESMILKNTTDISDVSAPTRSEFSKITDSLNNDRITFNDLAGSLSAKPNNLSSLEATKVRLQNSLNSFKDNDKILVRALIDEYDKAIGIASRATEATSVPRHKGTFPGGGTDYREKVTYLNEAIPGNSVGMRIDSSHFNEPNAVTFVRYDTRGVDNYGDTYFMVELQSDPHQSITKSASSHYQKFKKGEYEFSPVDMVRKNPNSKAIRTRVIKREIDDLLTRQNVLQKNAMERPLAPPEIDELDSIMKSIKTKERDLNRMPATLGEASSTQIQRGSTYDIDNKSYDFFPMGNESTWVKANIKGLISDARKNNKRYIALAPADFFQLTVNNKAKIEQFYGLGNKRLGDQFINVDSMKNFNNSDGSGFGKYRKYKKTDVDDAYSDSLPTEELGGMAVVPKAMKDVAKELGATFTTKKVFHTDQNKLYKIYDNSKKVPAYAFSKKYQMEEFFANLDRKSGLEMMKMETDDPRNFVESIVIDLQGTNKKAKMKAYKFGGLVQVDRSNFAPLF